MSENRLYAVPVVVALLVVGSLTAWQVVTSAQVVSEAAGAVAVVRPASQNTGALEECFDVSLTELAGCRSTSQDLTEAGQGTAPSRPLLPNECFDVPLGEICDK